MFEGAVAGLLNRLLGKYVQDLDTEHLNVGIFSGDVSLTDLKLKPEALYELDLPIDVKIGTIGRLNLQIPWTGLYAQPVVVNIEDVLILVGPAISNSHFDPEREKRLLRAAKRKILQDLESESEILTGPQNFFENLLTAIVNNLQIYVRNVHIRYEDSISSKDGPLACGLCLQSLTVETTNSKWKPCSGARSSPTSAVYQLVRADSLSLYWNPRATVLDDAETAHITPMQYYNWKHYMLTGLDKFSMHREDFEFLLKPVSCKVKVIVNRSGEARVPKLLVDAVIQDSALQLSRRQYLSIRNLLNSFNRIALNRKYRHLHPGVPLSKGVRQWWLYAYNVVLEQRVRPYTWNYIKRHRENYVRYKDAYKQLLSSPNDTELKLDLHKCEDSLPIVSVVLGREHAKFELLSVSPDLVQVCNQPAPWHALHALHTPAARVQLRARTSRTRSLWGHLTSPEKRKVCELIGYVEGAPTKEKPKQYIEHKLNLTLANCSVTLMNRSKEIVVLTLTQLLASLETRPSAKAYKLSVRAESILVEGLGADAELVPLCSGSRCPVPAPHQLALDLERRPASGADYGLSLTAEPLVLRYCEHSVTELINFFQTRSMTSEDLTEAWTSTLQRASATACAVGTLIVSRDTTFSINVDVKGPCLILPERTSSHRTSRMMLLDITRIHVKSDLQPANSTLEDATCMELEERLYDRIHAECECQVLFCEQTDPWREMRRHGDSELHLVPRSKIQVVFSNSIKKDYRLLPRYKLNVSISAVKMNLSDRIIGLLLDFTDNLPYPVPNTVPVSFLDSGDFTEDLEDPELSEVFKEDTVEADPGYKELVRLRQRIVAAYLSRNRAPESPTEASAARALCQPPMAAGISTELSDEDVEVFARSVDLPGFEDNVSPRNTIRTLMRLNIGEIVINLSRSTELTERPYVMLQINLVCVDVALMDYGPALQVSVSSATLADKQHCHGGGYLELLATGEGDLFNLLYRKVRADCPDFRSHFHSVEQSLVADAGDVTLALHSDALRTLFRYLQYIGDKMQHRLCWSVSSAAAAAQALWRSFTRPEADPPVAPGATKFSYSIRVSSIHARLCHQECTALEVRIGGLESEFVFRANDRMLFKIYLATLHADQPSNDTLYPALVWPDEDKVLEVKYVRAAPRFYGKEAEDVKANGEFRFYLGRLHVVLFVSVIQQLQLFLEPLIPPAVASEAAQAARCEAERRLEAVGCSAARLNLVIEIHAPVLLVPQKPSSPNLLVLNMGDLVIENFFKQLNAEVHSSSPVPQPVIDNILMKLTDVTLSRAVMTLAGTLEVQEPILEPLSIRCDARRPVNTRPHGRRTAPPLHADIRADAISASLGQQDLAALLAVWQDNCGEGQYIGSLVPSSPVEVTPVDQSVKKLQEFFAQGEPVTKQAVLSFTLEGMELKLFTDMDEVLSSPVRDLNHGLAKVTAGEVSVCWERYSDGASETRASLQSLLVEDIRPVCAQGIRRIFQSSCGSTRSAGGISVRRPPLLDVTARATAAARALDVRLDRTRLNLAPPFLLQLARALLPALPGDKTLEGGVVNHGYVGEPRPPPAARAPSNDSTSGYYSTATSIVEEQPSLTVSIQLRQPEVMLFTELSRTEGHALLLRSEVLIDYSCRGGVENLVLSLAGLQVMSKLQSKLKTLPPDMVLWPCDVELSKCVRSGEEGVRVDVSVSDIDIHLAATTVHTVTDIIEEITSELTVAEERSSFCFVKMPPRPERMDEELWGPRKLPPHVPPPLAALYTGGGCSAPAPPQVCCARLPRLRVLCAPHHRAPAPLLTLQMSGALTLHDWSTRAHGAARLQLQSSCFNSQLQRHEPLLQPLDVAVLICQGKAHSMSCKLETGPPKEPEVEGSVVSEHSSKGSKKKHPGFESETSADEYDTDNEMVFIKNPSAERHKSFSDLSTSGMCFLNELDGEESDSENESGLMDKLANAIGHLFTDESSGDENSKDSSSAGSGSEAEPEASEAEADTKAVPLDAEARPARKDDHRTVTLQEPIRSESVDSGLDIESATERQCTYISISIQTALQATLTGAAASALTDLAAAATDRTRAVQAVIVGEEETVDLVNDIGPGSTVHLISRGEADLAGNDRVIAVADYDNTGSRPSTPGCDTSAADLLDKPETEITNETTDAEDDWDCFEGGFDASAQRMWCASSPSPSAADANDAPTLYARLTHLRIALKTHDLDELTVLCPRRTVQKLHVLRPSRGDTRYYVVVDCRATHKSLSVTLRSPLQIRNETSYALDLFYKKSELLAACAGVCAPGELRNPFSDTMRVSTVAPDQTYNVPLRIAYHCKLYVLPNNFESYQTASKGLWWPELASELGGARDMVCPANDDEDKRIFAMRILTEEGVQSSKVTRPIPNYLIRVLPPLAIYNRLPYAIEFSIASLDYKMRVEAGERTHTYIVDLALTHRVTVDVCYMGLPWTGSFSLTPELTERNMSMWTECETDGGNKQLRVRVRVERDTSARLTVHAPYWLINKTGLPLQMKGTRSDTIYEMSDEPLLWSSSSRHKAGARVRVRAHHSMWSRAFSAAPAAPGLVVCAHRERHQDYRMLLTVTLSELCPQLTKIVTFLPYFLVYNDTKRHLRFMEENEAADLWIDLAPQQCTPFWPQTHSMALHCKFRDSSVVSQHFPITKNHFTVLRMDKGTAISVEVTGGTDRPFTVTFKPYSAGDAPVRIDNLCDDLFLKLNQKDSGQVALLSPYQSLLYTWDDPMKERALMWNIYNNKGQGYALDFSQDGYGEEKVSFHSVKHSTLVATNSVTSKLSSTLKRLTPRSPEPCSSSSDDSDSSGHHDSHAKTKKMRKDKVIVYWVSFMEGYQRVFVLAQDERIAYQYMLRINTERSNYEVDVALAEASLSVCVQNTTGVKELAYLSMTDSIPQWEVNVAHKWKQLSPDLAVWIEDKFRADQKKCQLKEYIHIDLEKMQMTKPFFSELRRTYNPGIYMHWRKSESHTYLHLKVNRLQIDNQLNDAVFPCVFYPALLPGELKKNKPHKPSIELVTLKQHRQQLNQDIYKYLKILVQAHCVNLDRGFVNYVFDILNHWTVEEKPAVRLRADLALVHMPLPIIALKSQTYVQRNVVFEYVHLSPVKLLLSLSSRDYSESAGSPSRPRFGSKKENRPKLFNSDLLEYVFNAWGTSLCDMKDVEIRMSYLELRNAPLTISSLTEASSRHYWTQLVQQFYVLVLGLNILGNPYSVVGDYCSVIKDYYEPHLGTISCGSQQEGRHVVPTGQCIPSPPYPALPDPEQQSDELPEFVSETSRSHPNSIALVLSAVVARPTFELCRAVRGPLAQRLSGELLRARLQRVVARRRPPRHCSLTEGIGPYSLHSALGRQLLSLLARGHYADTDVYLAHAPLPPNAAHTLLLTTRHIFLVRAGGGASWHVEWVVRLDDLIGVPRVDGARLVLDIRQDELVSYYSTDEKVIEIPDPELLAWLQSKVECALILAMEDKRCPEKL